MRLLLEYSGEHPTLPHEEFAGAAEALGLAPKRVEGSHRHELVEIEGKRTRILDAVRRLAFTFVAMEHSFSAAPEARAILAEAKKHPLAAKGSFAARARRIDLDAPTPLHPTFKPEHAPSGSQVAVAKPSRVEETLGEAYHTTNAVNLQHPDQVVRALLVNGTCHVGTVLWENDRSQYEGRKVKFRPMFSPVSMHPKVARALVNLARAAPGGLVYDPFCGTGGLLLEAGLVDARVIGSDIDRRMVQGSARNLDHFGVKSHTLFACDIGDAPRELAARLPVPTVDAIVTDMPYGRSATTKSEKPDALYARAFEIFLRVLRPGGRAVVGLPTPAAVALGERSGLALESVHPYRVHKSLTRQFAVFRAP